MNSVGVRLFFVLSLAVLFCGCGSPISGSGSRMETKSGMESRLYSPAGSEVSFEYEALYRTQYSRISDFQKESTGSLQWKIQKVLQYLVGPLVYRGLGGLQTGAEISLQMTQAKLLSGVVVLPYKVRGKLLLHDSVVGHEGFEMPVPYSEQSLETKEWLNCTDRSEADHATWSFFWYFWEPSRVGCDHREGDAFQTVNVKLIKSEVETQQSYPSYSRMVRGTVHGKEVAMTFGFGPVKDEMNQDPMTSADYGMMQFRSFVSTVRGIAKKLKLTESPVSSKLYGDYRDRVIGLEWSGPREGVTLRIRVVAAADIDQMDLFARSFAVDHEGFFGWFGHSRVGSGFDAAQFRSLLRDEPEKYSLTNDYQLIYWAGCNSYSYYTLPFFGLKAEINPSEDPRGTKNLDIVANALPSLFAFNSQNAEVFLRALVFSERKTSYQLLSQQVEAIADHSGYRVLVTVLGDEDNADLIQ